MKTLEELVEWLESNHHEQTGYKDMAYLDSEYYRHDAKVDMIEEVLEKVREIQANCNK